MCADDDDTRARVPNPYTPIVDFCIPRISLLPCRQEILHKTNVNIG